MIDEPVARWEGSHTGELARRWGVPAVHAFTRVGSTNDVARRLAAGGAPAGTVVLAEQQLAGRGRVGRGWESPPALGLWMTVVARPQHLPHPGALPLLAGLAVAEALDFFAGPATVRLKWPNDLVANGRKLGGILCEGSWEGDRPSYLVVGVGLNLLHAAADFPAELRDRATSLRQVAPEPVDRLHVAAAVVSTLHGRLSGRVELDAGRLAALEARDLLRGHEVLITEPATGALIVRGLAMGVSPEGALLVRTEGGAVRPVHSGTARLARPETE